MRQALVALMVGGLAVTLRAQVEEEPVYRGRPLGSWLEQLEKSPGRPATREASLALRELVRGNADVEARMIALMRRTGVRVHRTVTWSLAAGGAGAVDALVGCFGYRDPETRENAARSLGEIGAPRARSTPGAVRSRVEAAREDRGPGRGRPRDRSDRRPGRRGTSACDPSPR